jgi:single-strand DNA-binding protein
MADRTANGVDNHVFLRGVLADTPRVRTLPSGDELCSFRLTVRRAKGTFGRTRVDSIDCATTRAAPRRTALRCTPGDLLEVTGSLHRRFWRSAAGAPTSRYEVDVASARKAKGSTPRQE